MGKQEVSAVPTNWWVREIFAEALTGTDKLRGFTKEATVSEVPEDRDLPHCPVSKPGSCFTAPY